MEYRVKYIFSLLKITLLNDIIFYSLVSFPHFSPLASQFINLILNFQIMHIVLYLYLILNIILINSLIMI